MAHSHWDELPTVHLHCNTSVPEIILDTEWADATKGQCSWSISMEKSMKTVVRRLVQASSFLSLSILAKTQLPWPSLVFVYDHTHRQRPDAPPSHRPNAFPTSLPKAICPNECSRTMPRWSSERRNENGKVQMLGLWCEKHVGKKACQDSVCLFICLPFWTDQNKIFLIQKACFPICYVLLSSRTGWFEQLEAATAPVSPFEASAGSRDRSATNRKAFGAN